MYMINYCNIFFFFPVIDIHGTWNAVLVYKYLIIYIHNGYMHIITTNYVALHFRTSPEYPSSEL